MRGLIQITGYYNYKACGKGLKVDLLTNPRLLTDAEYACRSAAWFWDSHNLNNFADVGLFGATTKVINGGFTHAVERNANYARCRSVLYC